MRKEDVIAILLADIHLSLTPPVWRSNEPDWLKVQKRVLDEINLLQKVCDCPILCAGDVFDWWDSKPELINFAIKYLPNNMYCIAGQHDLPRHRYEDIQRSAFWTLVIADVIREIKFNTFNIHKLFEISGFPFGKNISKPGSCKPPIYPKLNIALIHEYIWIPGKGYPNAPEEQLIQTQKLHNKIYNGKLYGYDIIVYGDNHKGFQRKIGKTTVFNCGTLMRRASDEENYRPQVGLLLKDGNVVPHYLDISQDKHLTKAEEKTKVKELDIKAFFSELKKLGDSALDFKRALLRATNDKQVKEILIEATEK